MFNPLSKTLIHFRHAFAISRNPNLRCIQLLHFKYSTGKPDSQSFTVSYLINSCFFSPESALSVSKSVNFETPEKPDKVVSFFKNRGFSITQISFIVSKYPGLLLADPVNTLLPKLEFFYSKGVSNSDVTKIVTKAPKILRRSIEDHLVPAYDFLKGFLQSDVRTIASIMRFPGVLSDFRQSRLSGSIRMLIDVGVPEEKVIFFLFYQPRMFTLDLDRLKEILEDVLKLGFIPSKSSFVQAVHAIRSMSKATWERKIDVYKKWGLSEKEILAAFRSHPWCMTLSEEKIMLGMDFFVNKLGWESAAVARSPVLLSFSLKRRLIPRASVMQFLFQKGLATNKFLMVKPYMYSELEFLQNFVVPHLEKVPELSKIYHVNVDGGIDG